MDNVWIPWFFGFICSKTMINLHKGTYTSEVLDNSLLVTAHVKLLLAQYYTCTIYFLCRSNRIACQHIFLVFMSTVKDTQKAM